MKRVTSIFHSLFVFSIASTLQASPLKITSGAVTFKATGKPGFLKINGSGPELRGTLDKTEKGLSGEFSVTMDKFVTGIDLRDEHMKEKYFEVKKFPEATLKLKELPLDSKGQAKDTPFQASLKFHGVEKDVVGIAKVDVDGSKSSIEAEFSIALKDFNIDIPTYAGIKVADTVVISATLQTESSPL